jgi:isopentenyl-diphosphate delta-isomerase
MDRKQSHIDLALQQSSSQSAFDTIVLPHCALPDLNFADIDLTSQFLNFQLAAPMMISSMTGGTAESARINQHLAEAARECGIAFAVGSQRISREGVNHDGLDGQIRGWAGHSPIFGNVGLANLIQWNDADCLNRLAERINADAMIIHLNPMQEIFQDAGDINWAGSVDCLARSIEQCRVPVIVKEVGMGLSVPVIQQCIKVGAAAVDLAGSGGTGFIAIEGAMSEQWMRQRAAQTFANWGATTVELLQQWQAMATAFPIIASGGIRNGLDMAKCISLGANLTAIAGLILPAARHSTAECIAVIEQLKFELSIACWGTGCQNPSLLLGMCRSNAK